MELNSPAGPFPPVASEGGAPNPSGLLVAALDTNVCRDTRWCANCGGPQTFVAVYEFDAGRVGFCFGCGGEKFMPFSRAVSEVA